MKMKTMIENLLIWIAFAWLTNLIVWAFLPLQNIKPDYQLLNCSKCLGFWVGLLTIPLTTFYAPLIVSLLSLIIEKHYRDPNE